jgi:hypothetical protein
MISETRILCNIVWYCTMVDMQTLIPHISHGTVPYSTAKDPLLILRYGVSLEIAFTSVCFAYLTPEHHVGRKWHC